MFKGEKGITLVALVVTIVVLLILAGVSISLVVGQNGMITKANESKKAQEKAQKKPNMIKKAGFYAIKQYFSATKLHFLIFIITFASKTY